MNHKNTQSKQTLLQAICSMDQKNAQIAYDIVYPIFLGIKSFATEAEGAGTKCLLRISVPAFLTYPDVDGRLKRSMFKNLVPHVVSGHHLT